jgi:hypothetical protein
MIPRHGQPVSVFISTPCDDGHKLCYWQSLLALQATPPKDGVTFIPWPTPGDSLIPRARNNAVWFWHTQTRYDYLLFLDSDLEFVPDTVFSMVSHRLPIVCGLYGKKQDDLGWVINNLRGAEPFPIDGGLYKIACGGTGAMLLHRSVITAMLEKADWWWNEKHHWRIRYKDDNDQTERWHLFAHAVIDDPDEFPHSPRDMSEDWSFCYYARKIGFDVWLDTWARFLHEGSAKYPRQARRLTAEEIATGQIIQPDGTRTALRETAAKGEPV